MGNKRMNKLKSSIAASLILAGGFVCYLSLNVTSRVTAESSRAPASPGTHGKSKDEKLSETLRGRLKSTSSSDNEIVQVILQLNSSSSGRLNGLLQRNGIHLKNDFKELRSMVVELPLSVLDELAQFDEVEFISPDRELHLLGHVERT